ncbi:MAG: glycosyl transferase family 2 [Deltaproteobacteria bacterium]|nr:MAG: glycosyl transferase family 2 [Deltaproteobacteria bacterium]
MKTSVIVTTYNRPGALKRVVHGLLLQTRLPDEIVIADDGSSKKTQDLVKGFIHSSGLCRITHVWQEDKGFRAARIRNLAIQNTTGEYIISLDGDCIPEAHFIEDHLKLAKKGFFFQGKRVLVEKKLSKSFAFEDTKLKMKLIRHSFKNKISNAHHIFRVPFFPVKESNKLSGIKSCNMGFFRKDLYAVNGFNQEFTGWGREDSELAVRLYNLGLKRREHPFMAICFHLWHDENDKTRMEINDGLLKEQMASKQITCKNGIMKKG